MSLYKQGRLVVHTCDSLLGDDGWLVGVDEDAGRALPSSETPPTFILFLKRVDSLSTGRVEHIEIFAIHCWVGREGKEICKYFNI